MNKENNWFEEVQQNDFSDIHLDIEVNQEFEYPEESFSLQNQLQRTEQWREERKGNWTGSQFKNCMTCNSKGAKFDWFHTDKVFYFSEGAIKYIFANAMERKTGRYIETSSTKEMKYGTIIEPLIFKRAAGELEKQGLVLKLVGFKVFDNLPTAGVSSDAIVENNQGELVASGEFKACSSWSTLYERTFELMDEKGTDFWQTQGQMLAWNVEQNYYVVASPPQDITLYLNYKGDIMDLYDYWCNETEITIQVVKKSPIHLNALSKRLEIIESTTNRWLCEGGNLKEILYEEIDYFKSLQPQKSKFEEAINESVESISENYNIPKEELLKEMPSASFENISNELPF